MWEWTARIQFNKNELGTSFSVLIFLGTVPKNPKDWPTATTFVGSHYAFVSSTNETSTQAGGGEVNDEGFVYLNGAIAQHSGLNSLEPDVVKPYLTKQINWRVQRSDGTPSELQSLEVVVLATPLTWPVDSPFPVAGKPVEHRDITRGRSGGSKT